MIFGTYPFEAFALDARDLKAEEDESRLPIRWLAAAQVATRLSNSRPVELKSLINIWVKEAAEAREPGGVWAALNVPGIEVRDLGSAVETLAAIAAEALAGGGLHLAYCISMNARLTAMHRGPAAARMKATIQQAATLEALGLYTSAVDTYEAALEDAVRAGDTSADAAINAALEPLRRRPASDSDAGELRLAKEEMAWVQRMIKSDAEPSSPSMN